MNTKARIAWLVAARDASVASIRYRALYPALALQEAGHVCRVFSKPRQLISRISQFDIIIIVKTLDAEIIDLVSQASDRSIPVYLDLCDNILFRDYRNTMYARNRMVFDAISPYLTRIVTTGQVLKNQLKDYTGYPSSRISIIEDCIETPELLARSTELISETKKKSTENPTKVAPNSNPKNPIPKRASYMGELSSRLGLVDGQGNYLITPSAKEEDGAVGRFIQRVYNTFRYPRRSIAVAKEAYTEYRQDQSIETLEILEQDNTSSLPHKRKNFVLWFGNHGGPHSDFGMMTLTRFAEDLREVAKTVNFTLVIISNNVAKYKALTANLGLKTKFVPWSHDAVEEYLATSKVCLVPAGRDDFSLAKSANRHILALSRGVPVIADSLHSIKPFSECIDTEDYAQNIISYLKHEKSRLDKIQKFDELIKDKFDHTQMGEKWMETFHCSAHDNRKIRYRRSYAPKTKRMRVLILIDLIQDIELALSIFESFKKEGIESHFLVSERALRKGKKLLEFLIENKISPTFITAQDTETLDYRWIRGVDAVLTMSESDTNPHKIAHYIIKVAQSIGVPTYTLQHGFENIGLTYRDEEYPDVRLHSDNIFTWADPKTLPEWVPQDIIARSVGVGRIKPLSSSRSFSPADKTETKTPYIGVFENLHWSRYTDAYRKAFVSNLIEVATHFSEINFLLKTHPAGRWIETNVPEKSLPANVVLYSSSDHPFCDLSANQLAPYLLAAITTPSSVAIDCAENLTQTAIIGGNDCDTSKYSPLTELQSSQDWFKFINDVRDSKITKLIQRVTEFRDLNLSTLNAPNYIIEKMVVDYNKEKYNK